MRGLGTDIIEISRIEASMKTHGDRFVERLFSESERAYCDVFADRARRYAGRFAAKEAIAKALGCGFGKELKFSDIEILPQDSGQPKVRMSGRWSEEQFLVSISHCESHATAVAIWI